ncbi:MAG: tetratricopeptide repeat protein, partial [Flavobacteriaceae bacterium]
VPEVIGTYLEEYPNDANAEEMKGLLVDSYITSKNFKGAMELLERNRGYASKAVYQKVAFYRGVELFMDGAYEDASITFGKALDSGEKGVFRARAQYWKAEADYQLSRFDRALSGFMVFKTDPAAPNTPEYGEVDYNLAYTYFKLKDYTNGADYFSRYAATNPSDIEKRYDAYLRLGDSYFVSSKYWPAIETYNKALALQGPKKDYAAYQKAISYGFVGKSAEKISDLRTFVSRYPKSTLKDDALFELADQYITEGQESNGLRTYDQMIREFPGSSLVPQAMLRQGLAHYNAGRNEEALSKLKAVVRDFPNTQESIQAVATAKLVYVDLGRVNEYAAWVEGIDFVEVTDTELDNATYESADKKNMEGNIDAAIKGYEGYLKQFPSGANAVDAHFNLAQLYFGRGQKEDALDHYQYVADRSSGEYTEQAMARVCEIYVGMDDYPSAMPYLRRLEERANISQNRTFAQSNLMKGYYQQRDYERTLDYAKTVLETSNIDDRIKGDAHIFIARSAMAMGDEPRAKDAYAEVLKVASGETAAEALYYDAYFKYKRADHEGSNTSVQRLAKDFAAYKEWGGKGLILMAKNFYAMDDAYQATYILESVTQNFKEFPEIVAEAQAELTVIKSKEAQHNSSINPNGN